jgi:hypothetical protein
MPSSPLSLALAALATATLLARAMAPVAREARNCLLLWLALRGTRPEQRPQVIKALPSLEPPLSRAPGFTHRQSLGHRGLHPHRQLVHDRATEISSHDSTMLRSHPQRSYLPK